MTNGKGDSPRPMSVDTDTYNDNWERTFGKTKEHPDKEYKELLNSGMMWEMFPHLTGNWETDKREWALIMLTEDAQRLGLYDDISGKENR